MTPDDVQVIPSGIRSHGLTRLILIDSYSRGRIVEMNLQGGGVLTGRNGQGKTTLLMILQLFHGESPSRIVSRSTGRDSFLTHYLPNTTSYIIFEYARANGELCMAVHHADPEGRHLQHRFVGRGYEREMFLGEDGKFIETQALSMHLKKFGAPVSRQLVTQLSYRNILHNTPTRGSDEKGLAANYSIVPAGHRLFGIERIITGMFSKATNFDDLQNIVVRTLREDETDVSLVADRVVAEKWIEDRKAYTAIMAMRPIFENATVADASKRVLAGAIKGHGAKLQAFLDHAEERQNEISAALDACEDEIRLLDQQLLPQIESLAAEKAEAEQEAAARQRKSDAYVAQVAAYTQSDIEKAVEDVERIPVALMERDRWASRKQHIEEQAGDARVNADSRKMRIQVDADNSVNNIRDEIDRRRAEAEAELAGIENGRRLEEEETSKRHSAEVDTADALITSLAEKVASIKGAANQPIIPDAILDSVRLTIEEFDKRREVEMDVRREHSRKDLEKTKLERDEEKADRAVIEAEQNDERTRQALESATAFVQGPTGSLLALIRSDGGEACDRLSRVLRDDALLATNLNPRNTGLGHGLHGYEIDDQSLTPNEKVDPAKAREHQNEASRLHDEARTTLTDAREHHGYTVRQMTAKRRELEASAHDLAAAEKATQQADSDRQKAHQRQADFLHTEAEEIQRRLIAAQQELSVAKSQRSDLRDRHRASLAMIRKAHDERANAIRSDLITAQSRAADRQKDHRNTARRAIADIDADLARTLSSMGIDTTTITKLAKDIETMEKWLVAAEGRSAEVHGWRQWKSTEPAAEEQRQIEMQKLRDDIVRHANNIARLRSDAETRRHDVLKRQSALNHEQRMMTADVTTADSRVEAIFTVQGHLAPKTTWLAHDAIQDIIASLNSDEAAYRSAKDEVRRYIDRLDNAFRGIAGTQVYDYRMGGRHEAAGTNPLDGYRDWYERAHEDTRRLLVHQARGIADSIRGFYRQLTDFDKETSDFNRSLQKHLGEATTFEGVEGLEIEIVSKMKELDYWDRVQMVTDTADRWLTSGLESDMPDDAFVDALQSLIEIWRQSGSINTDLRSLIRIQGRVTEKGTLKKFTTASQLEHISSNGLSYLILVSIFVAFLNKMRAGADMIITWPLDELRNIDRDNTAKLVRLLKRNNVELVCAFPDPDPDVMRHFGNRYAIDEKRRLMTVKLPEESVHVL